MLVLRSMLLRKGNGGGTLCRGIERAFGVAIVGVAVDADLIGTSFAGMSPLIRAIGDGGTVGSRDMGGGRRLDFVTRGIGGNSNVGRVAVAGGGGRLKEIFQTGADGRARTPALLESVKGMLQCVILSASSSGELVADDSSSSTLELVG